MSGTPGDSKATATGGIGDPTGKTPTKIPAKSAEEMAVEEALARLKKAQETLEVKKQEEARRAEAGNADAQFKKIQEVSWI